MLLLWLVQTALAALSGYAFAVCVARNQGFLTRALTAFVVATATSFSLLQGLGLLGVLNPWSLSIAATLLHSAVIGGSVWRVGFSGLVATLRGDLAMPRRVVQEIREQQEFAAFALVGAFFAIAASLFIVWNWPNWSWDCAWYHAPMTNYPVQNGRIGWVETYIPYINSYPRLVELLAAWNILLSGNSRLDDLPQVAFGVMGALTVAGLCRRSGAGLALSSSLGAMWLALPAVFLQLHTTHADVAAATLFITGFYFLTAPTFSPLARWMTFVSFGLYAACKVTGLFHLILLAPLFAWRAGTELVRARGKRSAVATQLALGVLVLVWLGSVTYVQNIVHTGNPFWPARLTVPLFGWKLPGEADIDQIAGPPAFFGAPGAFLRMVGTWFVPSNNYYPDVKEGPFGVLFPYLLLPAFVLVAVMAPFRKDRWHLLSLVLLGVVATLVPAAWWGRFILALPAAALACLAAVITWIRSRWITVPLAAGAAALSVFGYVHAIPGYRVLPEFAIGEQVRAQDQVRLRKEIDWLFPPPIAELRESTLKKGDLVTYDKGMSFLGELWTRDLRNRVEYVPHTGDDQAWLAEIEKLGAVWIGVERRSRAERVLRQYPDRFEPLFDTPRAGERFYRVRQPFTRTPAPPPPAHPERRRRQLPDRP